MADDFLQYAEQLEYFEDNDMRNALVFCLYIAAAFFISSPIGAQNGNELSVEQMDARCEAGKAWACDELASKYSSANARTQNELQNYQRISVVYSEKGCNLNDFSACHNLGNKYFEGRGVARNASQAANLWDKACEGNNYNSCLNLGNSYFNGQGVSVDTTKAALLYKKVCFAERTPLYSGGPQACYNLGNSYYTGKGVSENPLEAANAYRIACEGDNGSGCDKMGLFYEAGFGVYKDLQQSAVFYRKACDRGLIKACTSLANLPSQVLAPPIDCASFPFTRTTVIPTESAGNNAVCNTIAKNLGTNQFRFISFIKTDAQSVIMNGAEGYTMFYSAEIEYTADLRTKCADTRHFLDADCLTELSVGGNSIRGDKLPRAAKSGARLKRSGKIMFERFEGGWKWLSATGVN